MTGALRLAVLVSGGGTNLQSLLDRFNAAESPPARVEVVIASRPGIGALERAASHAVPAVVLEPRTLGPERFGLELDELLAAYSIELVVLAGFLHLIPAPVVHRYTGRMINIHPALLPAFGGQGLYGRRVHAAVLAAGARVTGATVHLVDEVFDRGPIIAQWPVPVFEDDTPESLAARVLEIEHQLLPQVVEALAGTATPMEPRGDSRFTLTSGGPPAPEEIRRLVRMPGPGSASTS
jgi:phosphoribosylglycinamide formyltransferase 1